MKYSVCCRDCYDTCFFRTEVTESGLKFYPSKEHPITQGFLCKKGLRMGDWALNPNRIKSPLANLRKGVGDFVEVSLDEALRRFKEKVEEVIEKYGPERILVFEFAGTRGIINRFFPFRFFNKINASFVKYNLCDAGGAEALIDVYGTPCGLSPEDVKESGLVVYWGMNPIKTNLHGITYFRRKGFKIAVVDVRKSETARIADLFLKVKPGGDLFLALLMAKILVEENLVQRDFVIANSLGYQEFEDYVRSLDSHFLLEASGVPLDEALEFTRRFAQERGIIHIGYGFQRSYEGPYAVSFISYLPFLIGYLPGFIYDMNIGLDKDYVKGFHLREKPLRFIYQTDLARAVEDGDVKLLFIFNSNPISTNPNVNRLKKALLEKDVYVVLHDLYLTDTALFADLVFPAKSFFEYFDLLDSYYHPYVAINEKVFNGWGLSNYELAKKFSEVFGFNDAELFEEEEKIAQKVLEPVGITLEALRDAGYVRVKRDFKVSTPSGKVEFISARRKSRHIPDFPNLTELKENLNKNRDGLRLLSVTYGDTISSQYSNICPSLDLSLYMNPEDCEKLGIKEGKKVRVFNENGEIVTSVKLDDSLPQGTVLMYKAFWKSVAGFNVNELTTDERLEEFGGQAVYHSSYVKVEKFIEGSR